MLCANLLQGRDSIPNVPEESYPIGINARALHCFREIAPELEQRALAESVQIDGWHIYGGSRRVAALDSGTVFGTTRGGVNLMLYERAQQTPNVRVHFSHKLRNIDFEQRALTFSVRGGDALEVVCDEQTRVLAADGLYSNVRRAIETKYADFASSMQPWSTTHRVLFRYSMCVLCDATKNEI